MATESMNSSMLFSSYPSACGITGGALRGFRFRLPSTFPPILTTQQQRLRGRKGSFGITLESSGTLLKFSSKAPKTEKQEGINLGKTRLQTLWDKVDELRVTLGGNPHPDLEGARKITKEIEELAMRMRFAELKRKLRVRK